MRRTALITGGSRGIGRAACRALAGAGCAVAVGYAHAQDQAESLVRELIESGANAMAVRGDVRSRDEVAAMFQAVRARMGAVDTLVCCAGVAQQKLVQDITDADWDLLFDCNVKGVFHCVQAALPDMLRRGRGCVVTLSSMWGQVGASCESHYAAAKAAVIALTQSLAKELGPSGIRFNCVSPGTIETDMTAPLGRETLDLLAADTPLGRNGTPEDVAQAILYLCSDAAAFVTGQVLPVNGGFLT
jgi:3-oxoacyl-[acyl-carrier protein] reductase